MTTSGEQEQRPLTRRELRDLRARGENSGSAADGAADAPVVDTPDAAAPASAPAHDEGDTPEPAETIVPEAEDTRAPAADAPQGTHIVARSTAENRSDPPLTRRAIRRLRTNEIAIVTPDSDTEPAAEEASAGEPAASSRQETPTVALPLAEPERSAPNTLSPEQQPDRRELEKPTAGDDVPRLNPAFGKGFTATTPGASTRSFDDLMDQYTATSPSSIIMTSSHRLPEGLGSTGAARGTTDGREVDSVLIDGELPASSSPTPIAASEAISTQKSPTDVIRPPEPEKGRKAVVILGITAGVLGIVVVGALAGAFALGVFN
ncbi:hypothetical protein [Microbacterium amylolyticum]|uniref:Uncharacterized protein n=1 Tax=Microbacterium amylolyticum TaxID=936337 RepID=A0ABS4ZEG4_9MICO|nr:hypothetical protein [Microbacterium amylolyticum]MBP2435686.1 hypothetical protein [Microbacterium amylolyticum]